jgi:YesN/AraC family two-component response regulator
MNFKDICPFARFVRHITVDENTVFPPYFPIDARLFYVTAGTGKIEINNNILKMPSGSALYINSGEVYRLLPCNASYIAANFDFSSKHSKHTIPIAPINFNDYKNETPIEHMTFHDAEYFNHYYLRTDLHSLKPKLLELEKECSSKLPFYNEQASHLLASILTEIARCAVRLPSKEKKLDINEVANYIQAHYAEKLDNKTLSKIFYFHPNYINAEFKRSIGKSLHRYLLEVRIINAITLMESGQRIISEIAAQTGFSDTNYFSRYFKKLTGTTPGRYIKSCNINHIE